MSLADDSILISYINQNKQNPLDYLMSKLRDNDIVLLGEKHKTNRDKTNRDSDRLLVLAGIVKGSSLPICDLFL